MSERRFDFDDPETWDAFTDDEIWGEELNPDHPIPPAFALPSFYDLGDPLLLNGGVSPVCWLDDADFKRYNLNMQTGYVGVTAELHEKFKAKPERRLREKRQALVRAAAGVIKRPTHVQALGLWEKYAFAALAIVPGPLKRVIAAVKYVPPERVRVAPGSPRRAELWLRTVHQCDDESFERIVKRGQFRPV